MPPLAEAAGITKGRWSQIETGAEPRDGVYKKVEASDGTLAAMVWALMQAGVPITPERLLADAPLRHEAVEVLREKIRQEHNRAVLGELSLDPGDYPDGPLKRLAADPALSDADKRFFITLHLRLLAAGEGRGEANGDGYEATGA